MICHFPRRTVIPPESETDYLAQRRKGAKNNIFRKLESCFAFFASWRDQ